MDQLQKVLQKATKNTFKELNQKKEDENQQKDKIGKENTKSSKMSMISQIDQFKKGEKWSSFATQLDVFILLNDVPDNKKSALLLRDINASFQRAESSV